MSKTGNDGKTAWKKKNGSKLPQSRHGYLRDKVYHKLEKCQGRFSFFLESIGGKGLKRIGGMKGGSQSQIQHPHPRASEWIGGQSPAPTLSAEIEERTGHPEASLRVEARPPASSLLVVS
jgi:hypothetical protein